MKEKEGINLVLWLSGYRKRNKLSFYKVAEELSQIEGRRVGYTTVYTWINDGVAPRKKIHLQALRTLYRREQSRLPGEMGYKPIDNGWQTHLKCVSYQIHLLLPHLIEIVRSSDGNIRRLLRQEIGEDAYRTFLNCGRALASEMARERVLSETDNLLRKEGCDAMDGLI